MYHYLVTNGSVRIATHTLQSALDVFSFPTMEGGTATIEQGNFLIYTDGVIRPCGKTYQIRYSYTPFSDDDFVPCVYEDFNRQYGARYGRAF